MADAVARLLEDAPARRALADAASDWVARYDWREIARRTVASVRRAG
jgi:glycosyltransferase involved in cell wall biosynthesis